MRVVVSVQDDEPSGLAAMLGSLLEANLAAHPDRARLVRPSVVALDASDAGVAVTVRMTACGIEIADGRPSRATLAIRATSSDLLALVSAPLLLGLPSPVHADGRAVLRTVLARRIRVPGMLRHPLTLSRFARLVSVR